MSESRSGSRWAASVPALACVWAALNLGAAALMQSGEARTVQRALERSRAASLFQDVASLPVFAKQPAGSLLPCRVFIPEGASAGNRLPVILYLHGSGERGRDNLAQLSGLPAHLARWEIQRRFPSIVVAPQCPPGTDWRRLPHPSGDPEADPVMQTLDMVLTHPGTDARRVYLIGFSLGGFGAWELAMRHPEAFAALVPIAGGGDPGRAAALRSMPLWVVHGALDTTVPPQQSRDMAAAVRAVGGMPRYTELPHVAHDSLRALIDSDAILAWLFRQSRESAPRIEAPPSPRIQFMR